jgi:hypothetical protein
MVGQGVPEGQAADFLLQVYLLAEQPMVTPAYIKTVVFFLAVLALFIDDRKKSNAMFLSERSFISIIVKKLL